jgi:PAS domain S-box-containing protein
MAAVAGAYASIAGLISLIGWVADLRRLTDWDGNGISIQPNTAIAAMSAGAALLALAFGARRTGAALGSVAGLIGATALFQHISGLNLGIDTLLMFDRPWGHVGTRSPGRMGPPAATSFMLSGVALVLAGLGTRTRRFLPAIGLAVITIATLSLIGYLFGASAMFTQPRLTAIALQTATILFAVGTGLVAFAPEYEPVRLMREDSAAGMLFRRALPFIVLVPVAVGWLRLRGEKAGLYDVTFGAAMLVLVLICLLVALLGFSTAAIRRREQAQRQAERSIAMRAAEQSALYAFTDRLHRAGSRSEVYESALDAITTALGCRRASILLLDAAGAMRFAAWRGLGDGYRRAVEGHSPWAIDERNPQPLCIDDVTRAEMPEPLKAVVMDEGIGSLAFIPLIESGRLLGKFMLYYDAPRSFADEEIQLALTVARQLAFGVNRVRASEERARAGEALRESEQRFARFMQHLPGLAWIKDLTGRYVFVNDAAEAAFGMTRPQLYGKRDRELFPADTAAQFAENDRKALASGSGVQVIETLADHHGVVRHSLVTKFPIPGPDGQPALLGGMAIDITDQRRVERERTELLAREQAARAELERANRAKDEFLAVLSHELRTPLTPVLTTVQMMERDASLAPDHLDSVSMIRRNVELEARLIDDLLDLTRISRGKLELFLGPVDVHEKIRHVARICDGEVRSKGLTLTFELRAQRHHLRADAARLQQVLWNLLKNAVKFTPDRGSIRVRTENADTGQLQIEVNDTGCGIAPAVLPTIFDAFVQGGCDVTRRHGGLGLGLTISKRLVEMHGGTLAASSGGEGKGSSFLLQLPVGNGTADEHPADESQGFRRSRGGGRILLVEDNVDTSKVMSRVLRHEGYEIWTADSVASGLRVAASHSFDLLICDIGLPDGSGLDLMRQLLAKNPIRAIALSGFGMEEDVRRSKEAGFVEHLTKPVNLQHLEAVIRRHVADSIRDHRP